MSAAYDLVTTWRLAGARAPVVYDALEAAQDWPQWWRGLRSVTEVEPGGPGGIGQVARLEWRAALPYSMIVDVRATRRERPTVLEAEASGDLHGIGRFEIAEGPGLTMVVYSWEVETTKPWMRRTAPLLRPVFVWGHDRIMRAGGRGLSRHLGAPLLQPAAP